jgi:hypothetical protein
MARVLLLLLLLLPGRRVHAAAVRPAAVPAAAAL